MYSGRMMYVSFVIIAVFTLLVIAPVQASIVVVQDYTFDDNAAPVGFITTGTGTPTYSNGSLVLDGTCGLQGISPLTATTNFGLETMVTVPIDSTANTAFFAFLTDGSTNGYATCNYQSNWQGIVMHKGFIDSGISVAAETKVALALVREGTTTSLYVDGVMTSSLTSDDFIETTDILNIGNSFYDGSYANFVTGSIDQVRLFTFTPGEFDPGTDLLAVPNIGTFSTALLTGDADCGVSDTKTYTHAYTLGKDATDVIVNGVTFTGVAGTTPAGSNFSTSEFLAELYDTSSFTHNVTGDIGAVIDRFVYDWDTTPSVQNLTLTGLEVGKEYTTTFYNSSWGDVGGREVTIRTSLGDKFVFDENFSSTSTEEGGSLFMGNMLSYSYTATDTSMSFNFTPDMFHLYGFTNEEVTVEEEVPGDANHDGKVDGSDVTILAGNWQAGVGNPNTETVTWEMGDFNHDGQVDGSDVTILAGNWQAGVTAATAAVPEPSTLVMLLSVFAAFAIIRRVRMFR